MTPYRIEKVHDECPEMVDLRQRHGLVKMEELTEYSIPAEALLSKILRRLGN